MLKLTKRHWKSSKGPQWVYQITGTGDYTGKPYDISAGTRREKAAEAKLQEVLRKDEELSKTGPNGPVTFEFVAEQYMQLGGEKASWIGVLIQELGDRRMTKKKDGIADADLADICVRRYPGCSAASHKRLVYTPVQAIWNFGVDSDLCEPRRFVKPKVEKKEVSYADEKWLRAFARHANKQCLAVVIFLSMTGARVGEALALTWADIDLERSTVTIRMTKTGRTRVTALAPLAVAMLLELGVGEPTQKVFGYGHRSALNKAIRRACHRAGITPLSSHRVGRHAFAARLLSEGASLLDVMEAGGWKSLRMLQEHYGHLEKSRINRLVTGQKLKLHKHLTHTPAIAGHDDEEES